MTPEELLALADQATPGPWVHADESGDRPGAIWHPQAGPSPNIALALSNADAAFIAACDPATIRSLVAAVRERDELRAAIHDLDAAAGNLVDLHDSAGDFDGHDFVHAMDTAVEDLREARAALHREDGA